MRGTIFKNVYGNSIMVSCLNSILMLYQHYGIMWYTD